MSPRFRFGQRKPSTSASGGPAAVGVSDLRLQSKLGLLRSSDLFSDLDDRQMGHVEEMTVMTHAERGRLIYSQGETAEALFLLKRGKVNIYRITPDGRKLLTAVVEPGTLFGNMAFTGTTMQNGFAETVKDSTLCVMSRHDIEELVREYPSVGIRLLDTVSRRVRELEARLEEGLLCDMPSRVAAALLRLREHQGGDIVAVTHQELADNLGTYRETVTHTLGDLQDRGLVALRRGCIEVVDVQALSELIASEVGQD
jgi:CRP/FNR family cyclic AMP-dependent transcriptional regulator